MVATKEKIVENEINLWTKAEDLPKSEVINDKKGRNTNKKSVVTSKA